ncbi:MAG: hypothetical protein ACIWVG_02745, partial [Gloeotrichia echinulata HAB0833]
RKALRPKSVVYLPENGCKLKVPSVECKNQNMAEGMVFLFKISHHHTSCSIQIICYNYLR